MNAHAWNNQSITIICLFICLLTEQTGRETMQQSILWHLCAWISSFPCGIFQWDLPALASNRFQFSSSSFEQLSMKLFEEWSVKSCMHGKCRNFGNYLSLWNVHCVQNWQSSQRFSVMTAWGCLLEGFFRNCKWLALNSTALILSGLQSSEVQKL